MNEPGKNHRANTQSFQKAGRINSLQLGEYCVTEG